METGSAAGQVHRPAEPSRPSLWRRRLTFWIGGALVGLVSVGFAAAAALAERVPHWLGAQSPCAILAVAPIGFALSMFVSRRFFPGSESSGIPQTIAARASEDDTFRARLLSLRVAIAKIALTLFGIACGASIGREGPTVQIGAAIMLKVSRGTGVGRVRGLLLAGAAAGVAAAFNAPLAGIVFAIEELGRAYDHRISPLVLTGVVISGAVALAINGNHAYFGATAAHVEHWDELVAIPLAGVLGGALGAVFSRVFLNGGAWIAAATGGFLRTRPVVMAALCGLVVAMTGLLSSGAVLGSGYDSAKAALAGTLAAPWAFLALKYVATMASGISRIPGGIFAPSLTIGAALGAGLSGLVPGMHDGVFAVLAMAGYFTGVVQAPITAFTIVIEMTETSDNILPIMATTLIAQAVARLIQREPLYHVLSERYLHPKP